MEIEITQVENAVIEKENIDCQSKSDTNKVSEFCEENENIDYQSNSDANKVPEFCEDVPLLSCVEDLKIEGDDLNDIDLSEISVAPSAIDETLAADPDFAKADEVKEIYDNIMNVCSTTAQVIKKTISDVLNSRENVVIISDDPTNDLEISLSQKIADFENVVSGCFSARDVKTGSRVPNPVTITEIVEEPCEDSVNSVESEKKNAENNQKVKPGTPELSVANVVEEDCINSSTNESQENSVTSPSEVEKEKSNVEKSCQETRSVSLQKEPAKSAPPEEKSSKKQQKSSSNKKKGEKTVDQVMKSLANYSSTDEKLQALCKRHVEILEELRSVESRFKQLERQVVTQQREKEQLQADHNRMILAKSRLESLCRELQRQSRVMKEENLLRIREEEEKRKEVANKFQTTLNDISALMQEHSKKNIQLREENAELARKLKSLVEHYETWEKHMEKVVQQKDLEAQLAKAKHSKVTLLLKQETEKFLREKQALLQDMSELQKKCTMLTSNEMQLRTELGDYTSKYEEFQTVLNKSSEVFASFKNDMEATSKKIKKLEKETNTYKQKWESSNNALLDMINAKQKHDKELMNAQQRIITLEKLCRALQSERNELQNQLNVLSSNSIKTMEENVPSNIEETQVA